MAWARFIEDNARIAFECPGCGRTHIVETAATNGNPGSLTVIPNIVVQEPLCISAVSDGFIHFALECAHALAGQTVNVDHPELL